MKDNETKPTRKKFLLWTAITVCSATILKFLPKGKQKEKISTVKMLGQDGKLVEVDTRYITAGPKISNEELQKWVKK